MDERKELLETIKGEIAHNITPVIGWLRWDAKKGRADDSKDRLNEYRKRLDKAAEDVLKLIESRQEETSDDDKMYARLGYTWSEETQTWIP